MLRRSLPGAGCALSWGARAPWPPSARSRGGLGPETLRPAPAPRPRVPPRSPRLVSSPSPFGGGGGAGERGAGRAASIGSFVIDQKSARRQFGFEAGFVRPLSFRLCPVPQTDRCSQQVAGDFSPLPQLPRVPTPSFLPCLHPHPHHFGTAQDLFKPWETGSGPGFALILFKNWRHRRGL